MPRKKNTTVVDMVEVTHPDENTKDALEDFFETNPPQDYVAKADIEADTEADIDDAFDARISPPITQDVSYPKLIGVAGYKESGKDTAADFFIGHEPMKMADCLKDMLRTYLSFRGVGGDTIEDMVEGKLKEVPSSHFLGKTPRWAMQSIGTEWGRHLIGDEIWIDSIKERISAVDQPVIITDIRFKNEAKMVHELGGKVIRIVRDGHGFTGHESESEIEYLKVDAIIGNNGTIADLHEQLHIVVESLA